MRAKYYPDAHNITLVIVSVNQISISAAIYPKAYQLSDNAANLSIISSALPVPITTQDTGS